MDDHSTRERRKAGLRLAALRKAKRAGTAPAQRPTCTCPDCMWYAPPDTTGHTARDDDSNGAGGDAATGGATTAAPHSATAHEHGHSEVPPTMPPPLAIPARDQRNTRTRTPSTRSSLVTVVTGCAPLLLISDSPILSQPEFW
jgi:hypothetical protein